MQHRKNKIYFAFPGMGKTTYARSHANFLDLDFGNFRSAMKVAKGQENSLFEPFSRLMKYYYKDGYDIMTNEPGLIPWVKQFAEGDIVMLLPSDGKSLVNRVYERERARHVNAEFPKLLADNFDVWVSGWDKIARQYKIPVIYSKYFQEVQNAV